MSRNKHRPGISVVSFILFFLVYIIYTSGAVDLSIGNATPFLLLPMIIAYSCFSDVVLSAAVGLIVGIALDTVMHSAFCFNAIALLLVGMLICYFSNTLFNKNIFAVSVMSALASFGYFIAHWLTFHCFGVGYKAATVYLFQYAVPSAVYTAFLIIPCFYVFRYFNKLTNGD